MAQVELLLNGKGHGAFLIREDGQRIAEMVIAVDEKNITVYHTEVDQKAEGRGLAKELLASLVSYAREHKKKVIPLCPFVHAQFKRHPLEFADIWNKEGGEASAL